MAGECQKNKQPVLLLKVLAGTKCFEKGRMQNITRNTGGEAQKESVPTMAKFMIASLFGTENAPLHIHKPPL